MSVVGVDLSNEENWPAIRHILEPRSVTKLLPDLPNVSSRSDLQQLLSDTQFNNVASFLSLPDSDEPLDRTRVHPEDYIYARKIAADALDMDEYTEDDKDAGEEAIKRIIRKPTTSLEQLDLSDYARELSSRFGVLKSQTLLDIRSELINPFKDFRLDLPAVQMASFYCLANAQWGQIGHIGTRTTGHRQDRSRSSLMMHYWNQVIFRPCSLRTLVILTLLPYLRQSSVQLFQKACLYTCPLNPWILLNLDTHLWTI